MPMSLEKSHSAEGGTSDEKEVKTAKNTRHGRTLKTAYTKQFVSQAEQTGSTGSFEGHTDAQTKDRITNRGLVIFKETRN